MTEPNGFEVDARAFRCRQCNSPLMNTHSGSICPNGHGGIFARMPSKVKKYNHAIILGVPTATNKHGQYYLPDGERIILDKEVNRELTLKDVQSHVIVDGKIWRYQRTWLALTKQPAT